MNIQFAEDQVLNIVNSHESSQPNISATIKSTAKVARELNK
jgi:hypothetical protein